MVDGVARRYLGVEGRSLSSTLSATRLGPCLSPMAACGTIVTTGLATAQCSVTSCRQLSGLEKCQGQGYEPQGPKTHHQKPLREGSVQIGAAASGTALPIDGMLAASLAGHVSVAFRDHLPYWAMDGSGIPSQARPSSHCPARIREKARGKKINPGLFL